MNKQPPRKPSHVSSGALDVQEVFWTLQGEGPFTGTPCVFVRLQGCNLQCPGCDTVYEPTETEPGLGTLTPKGLVDEVVLRMPPTLPVGPRLVVITGGEPFRQNLMPFVLALKEAIQGVYIQIETNGTLPVQYPEHLSNSDEHRWRFYNHRFDERRGLYIVCSPKTPQIHMTQAATAGAFKYVLDHRSVAADGLPDKVLLNGMTLAKTVWRQAYRLRPIYLQPMDHTQEVFGVEGVAVETERHQRNRALNWKSLEAAKESCLAHGYIFQVQTHKIIGVR